MLWKRKAVALAGGWVLLASPAPSAVADEQCASSARGDGACFHVTVPLDRSGRVPGSIDLRARMLADTDGSGTALVLSDETRATRDELSAFHGELEPLATRRIAMFDLRGTGASRPLRCRALARAGDPTKLAAACAAELGPARGAYTAAESIADVEAVRSALGAERFTLYALGHAARVALGYAAAYPQRVSRLVLDSPVAPEGADPFARSRFAAIAPLLRANCRTGCGRYTRDPVGELTTLVARARLGTLHGRFVDGRGRARSIAIRPADLLGLLLDGDGSLFSAVFGRIYLTSAVHAALAGDRALLARLVATRAQRWDAPLRDAFELVRTCTGTPLPWLPGTPPADRPASVHAALAAIPDAAFAPFTPADARRVGRIDLCREWPDEPLQQPLSILPATPTLILSGRQDLSTPPADAAALARRMPSARLYVAALGGHRVLSTSPPEGQSCAARALAAFASDRPEPSCAERGGLAWPTLPPRELGEIERSGHRLPLRVARTVRAVRMTLLDLSFHASSWLFRSMHGRIAPGWGGLRGGFARFDRRGLAAHRYSYVPGVTVSTRIFDSTEHRTFLRIGGPAAVQGRLRLTPCEESSCYTGLLGGHGVRIRIPGSA